MGIEQFKRKTGTKKPKPAHVASAHFSGATDKLSAFGRKGAEVTNTRRAQERIEDEMFILKRAEEALTRAQEANEDIVPPQ